MPLPFDATLKDIVASRTRDYETALNLPPGPATVLNVDLSTLSAATDVALGYGEPLERIVDLNFQAGFAENLARRVLLYNTVFHYRFAVPVHSLVVLLRPAADVPNLTGKIVYEALRERGKVDFTYEVVRLWHQPVERFLQGGLGTLPLAPLCQLPGQLSEEEALKHVIQEIDKRLRVEATPQDAAKLLMATYILTGLRVGRAGTDPFFQGVGIMRESSTYLGILEEGQVNYARELLLRQGSKRFGPPDPPHQQILMSLTDPERLDRMIERMMDDKVSVANWPDLLATP